MQALKKYLFILSSSDRKKASLLLIMIILMALIDTLGVVSILPFMAVLSNPSLIETNFILNNIFQISKIFGVENNQQFFVFLGFLVFILLVVSLIVRVITIYSQVKFIEMLHYNKAKSVIESYLNQPYHWFLNQNSSEIGATILEEVRVVVSHGIHQLLEIIAKGAIVITITILLIIIDPKLAFVVGLTIGSAYVIIFSFLRKYLSRIGKDRLLHNQLRFKVVDEAFNAIKEVKLGGLEQSYINRFTKSAGIFARVSTSADVIKQLPRFFLETIVFGGILILLLYLMIQTGSFNNALPIISLYAFAGYRMMPALQQVYASLTVLNFTYPSLDRLYNILKDLKTFNQNQNQEILPFVKSINLKNIHYNYPKSSRTVLKDINITIPAKSSVALIGATGCGKSTIADIILGLLEPQKGSLEVDGQVITRQNSRSWQRSIGYVPQTIYLSDDTVAANIAMGEEPENFNHEAIQKAAKIANLHNFIIKELPDQYQTTIGENGVRLSGGQRQRIGIARALYQNPKVLVLDEATSALDNETEKAVMEAANNLDKDVTIIIIAHRLNTVQNCDIVFKLEKGQLIKKGKFSEITDETIAS
jgi:ABC-type multidrug transport system fused ATPase/permease subunit